MTDREQLRWRIGDQLNYNEESATGDGSKTVFKLAFTGVQDLTVTDDGTPVSSADYTLDPITGTVVFDTAPVDSHTVKFVFKYAAFTDSQLDDILAEQSNVRQSAIFCIDALMADAAKRFSYSQGQSKMNVNEVFEQLKKLKESVVAGQTPKLARRRSRFYDKDQDDKTDLGRIDLGEPEDSGDLSRISS